MRKLGGKFHLTCKCLLVIIFSPPAPEFPSEWEKKSTSKTPVFNITPFYVDEQFLPFTTSVIDPGMISGIAVDHQSVSVCTKACLLGRKETDCGSSNRHHEIITNRSKWAKAASVIKGKLSSKMFFPNKVHSRHHLCSMKQSVLLRQWGNALPYIPLERSWQYVIARCRWMM